MRGSEGARRKKRKRSRRKKSGKNKAHAGGVEGMRKLRRVVLLDAKEEKKMLKKAATMGIRSITTYMRVAALAYAKDANRQ